LPSPKSFGPSQIFGLATLLNTGCASLQYYQTKKLRQRTTAVAERFQWQSVFSNKGTFCECCM